MRGMTSNVEMLVSGSILTLSGVCLKPKCKHESEWGSGRIVTTTYVTVSGGVDLLDLIVRPADRGLHK